MRWTSLSCGTLLTDCDEYPAKSVKEFTFFFYYI